MYKIFAIITVLLLASCSSTKYVPVETVRTEWRDRVVKEVVADTVNDTRIVFVKGDSIIDYRYRDRIKRIEVHDTIHVQKTDTIREPYPIERKLSRWESIKMDFGGMAIGALAIAVFLAVFWFIKRIKR